MSHTNSTANYNLPQFIGSDKPAWLGDINPAMSAIDTALKNASDNASTASTASTANTTAIGDLSTLTTTSKTNLVGAINEIDSDLGTVTTQVGTNTGDISGLDTRITNVSNDLNSFMLQFNLSDVSDSSLTLSGLTNNLHLAQNSTGTIFKLYGDLKMSNGTFTRTKVTGTADRYGIATGLFLNSAPSQAYYITGSVWCNNQNTSNYNNTTDNRPLGFDVGTDGQIFLWSYDNSSSSTTVASGHRCTLWFPPCVYFNADFGDQPE